MVVARALHPGDVAACLLMVLARLVVLALLVFLVVLALLVFLVVLAVLVLLVDLALLVLLVVPAVPLTHVVVRCFRLCLPLLLR